MTPEDEIAKQLLGSEEEPEVQSGRMLDTIANRARDPEATLALTARLGWTLHREQRTCLLDQMLALAAVLHTFVHAQVCQNEPLEELEIKLVREFRRSIETHDTDAETTFRALSGTLLAIAEGALIGAEIDEANAREGAPV